MFLSAVPWRFRGCRRLELRSARSNWDFRCWLKQLGWIGSYRGGKGSFPKHGRRHRGFRKRVCVRPSGFLHFTTRLLFCSLPAYTGQSSSLQSTKPTEDLTSNL
eukprot:3341714-Amphidinium_carterae.1